MRSLRIVAFAALAASALGCKWIEDIKKNSGPRPTGKIGDVPAAHFVKFLNERADKLHSVEYDDITMRVSGKGVFPATLRGELIAAQPRNFRLFSSHRIADAKLDMGSNEEGFWVFVETPKEKPLYLVASHADFASGKAKMPDGMPFEPGWVLEALGMAHYPENRDYAVAVNARDRTFTLSWTAKLPNGAVRKEIVFDADAATGSRPQVKKHVILNATTNKVIATAEILSAQTERVGVIERSLPAAIQYPTRVVLKWTEPRFEMDLNLDKATTNAPMTSDPARRDWFTRPNFKDVRPIDLAGGVESK
jgi:hypothetical protein